MGKQVVIYHRADFDGLFCREIARRFLPEAELIGWDYGDATPAVPPVCELYMLDVSVDEWMGHGGLIWIDHHRSAMEKYPKEILGYRIDGVAACRLAWQYFKIFHPTAGSFALPKKEDYVERRVSEPLAVRLAGEYDIWDKRDAAAEVFQHGLRSQELTQGDWNRMLDDSVMIVLRLLEGGRAVEYAARSREGSMIRENGFTLEWEGLMFLACNAGRCNSNLFTAGLLPEHEGCLGFRWNGKEWAVSLYGVPGKPEVDLAAIAVKYGGGGHKQACGFRCARLPFMAAANG